MTDLTRRNWLSAAGMAALAGLPMAAMAGTKAPVAGTHGPLFDIRAFGAVADARTNNAVAVQKAIDACSAAGGGQVLIADGRYVTGTIYLKSNVRLHVEAGAALLGSPDIADYATDTHYNMYAREAHMDRCLIFARDAVNIGLEGRGVIDGQGASFPNAGDPGKNRPMLIRFLNCQRIALTGLSLINPASWTSAWLYCSDIHVDGISITSRARPNGDGLDFDGCRDVRIANSRFDNSDDCICLQSSLAEHGTRNIVITNCIMTSRWAAIRIGLLSYGDFQDIAVSNCVFHDIEGEGLKIQLNEGGRMDNLHFANIVMRNVPRPIFMTFNSFSMRIDPADPLPPMRRLRNVTFSDMRIEASEADPQPIHSFIAIVGLPGHKIEDVTLRNIQFTAPGGGSAAHADRRDVPDFANVRPESRVLAPALPSFGLYAHHVRGLTVSDVRLDTQARDMRPAIFCNDVDGLRLSNVQAGGNADVDALIGLEDVSDVFLQGCAALTAGKAFLRVEGAASHGIGLTGNDLRRVGKPFVSAPEVASDAVLLGANLTR